ncbi:MAG: rhodanese-like domain-containing protein [Acidobacteriota bacterium]
MVSFRRALVEAVALAAGVGTLALAINAVRPGGLPLVARQAYQTLVPCPEPGGPVTAVDPSDPALRSPRTFVIDARPVEEYGRGHEVGAANVPYDWLDPVSPEEMARLARQVAASRATRVVVYGDGGRPDSGEHLGREISSRGIKNVSFVRGGAPALLDSTP